MGREIVKDEGLETIELYVLEVPEECNPETCPFCLTNVNKDKLEDPDYYCFLKSDKVSAQFGGTDVKDPEFFMCPLKALEESEPYINHEERIKALEEAVFG